jgi:hypothetical protein
MRTIMNPFRSWQQLHRSTQPARRARRRTNALRPAAPERLEDRTVPSTITLQVTSLGDSSKGILWAAIKTADKGAATDQVGDAKGGFSGKGTLRWAIKTADKGAATNSYVIDIVTPGTINLKSALPDLSRNITITGLGASTSTVQRDAATSPFRIFTVDAGETVRISGLEIWGGKARTGGGIDNFGTLTVSGSSFTRNSAAVFGGGLDNERGGTATVSDSTFTSNSATLGGGLANERGATATVSGSTFTRNSARIDGGAIKNFGTLITHNATLTGDGESNLPNGIS